MKVGSRDLRLKGRGDVWVEIWVELGKNNK